MPIVSVAGSSSPARFRVTRPRIVVAPGDPVAQARQCLDNLFTLIAHHGFSKDDIHQLTVYVVGPHSNLIDAWGEVASCFEQQRSAGDAARVTFLGYRDQVVEIDAVVDEAGTVGSPAAVRGCRELGLGVHSDS